MDLMYLVSQLDGKLPAAVGRTVEIDSSPADGRGSGSGFHSVPPAGPDPALVERFNARLAGPLPGDDLAGPQDLRADEKVESPDPANRGERRTVGDAILSGLGGLSRDLQNAWDSVRGVSPGAKAEGGAKKNPQGDHDAETPPPGAGLPRVKELLEIQRSMVEFSFLFEAVGKGTSKAIENTNQLVKMQ